MFHLLKLHVTVHLKSGQKLRFRARKVSVKFNDDNITTYTFDGMTMSNWAVPIHQIAAIEFKEGVLFRLYKWVLG